MYLNSEYTHFSLTDVSRFERWMYKWCTQVCIHGRSMIVFDYNALMVNGEHAVEVKDNQVFHHYILPNLTLQFIFISKEMCVLTKVLENKTSNALYTIPDRWYNVELWPAT